jgi:hypothetical protein
MIHNTIQMLGRRITLTVIEQAGQMSREPSTKPIVGATEMVRLIGDETTCEEVARSDAGEARSWINADLVDAIGAGPALTTKPFRTSNDERVVRPIVSLTVCVRGREHEIEPCVMDREGLSTDVRLGRDVLGGNYLIDVEK